MCTPQFWGEWVIELDTARAVKRLGLTPKVEHQDITRFHVDREYNRKPPPEDGSVHIPRGYRYDSKPDLRTQPQACLLVALQVLDGSQNNTQALCRSVNTHIEPAHCRDWNAGEG